MISDLLLGAYPWIKAVHVMAVIAWMAGLFYLPRLFVYHSEEAAGGSEMDRVFQVMERKLLGVIMGPAMVVAWVCGLVMLTMGAFDFDAAWSWIKIGAVIGMTWMHVWLGQRAKEFAAGQNVRSGRTYRLMNEVPTVLMVVIVIAVIVRPF